MKSNRIFSELVIAQEALLLLCPVRSVGRGDGGPLHLGSMQLCDRRGTPIAGLGPASVLLRVGVRAERGLPQRLHHASVPSWRRSQRQSD